MRIVPELSSAGIHLTGSFNPTIFSPDWLGRHKFVSDALAKSMNVKVIHAEIAVIEAEWFVMRITRDRFIIESSEAPFIRISDLTSQVFGNVLMHTPAWGLAIHRGVHFSPGSAELQHKIGRLLAPIEPWGEWGQAIERADQRSGLSKLTMTFNSKDGKFERATSATVAPSVAVKVGSAIQVEVQDVYALESGDKTVGCLEIVSKLATSFQPSLQHAEGIIDHLMSLKERFS